MAFDRKHVGEVNTKSEIATDNKEKDPLKEFVNKEESKEALGEEAENEQKRKEAMTERD